MSVPAIKTDRLTPRAPALADAPAIIAIQQDIEVAKGLRIQGMVLARDPRGARG